MQAGNEGNPGVAAVAQFLGLQTGDPAALLFIEAVEYPIQLAVQLAFGMIGAGSTHGALALMDRNIVHDEFSVEGRHRGHAILRRDWK